MSSPVPKARSNFSNPLIILGLVLVFISLTIFGLTFFPVIKEEVGYLTYRTNRSNRTGEIVPVDKEFGIVIPKIGANAKVVANVNPYDSKAYQQALTKGVAHAKGTKFFIFSHSSVNFYEAARYNSIFYLLNKLEPGDEIDLFYKGEKFTYAVTKKEIVAPEAVNYLSGSGAEVTLTLMTCWPAGTTLKRLVVMAEPTR